MKDYSHLEGKIIRYFNGVEEYRGKVVLIDPDIGITLVDADNPEHYLSCLVMPGSPKWRKEWGSQKKEAQEDFKKFIKIIESGEFITNPRNLIEMIAGSTLSAEDCPF